MVKPLNIRSLMWPVLIIGAAILLVSGATGLSRAEEDEKVVVIKSQEHGWLGITMQDLDADMAEALDLQDATGVLINSVYDDSPAEEAGLKNGDVIVTFNGMEIGDTDDLSKAVRKTEPEDEVELVVIRDGQRRNLTATVGERKMGNKFIWSDKDNFSYFNVPKGGSGHRLLMEHLSSDHGYMGVSLQGLNEQLGDYFGVENGEGVLITEIMEESPAETAGLLAGDVIVKIDTENIAETDDLYEYLGKKDEGEEVEVTVVRNKRNQSFTLTLAEMPDEFAWHGDDDIEVFMSPGHGRNQGWNMRVMPHGVDPHLNQFYFHSEDEMEELKEELDELRQELKELRKDLENG